MASIQDQPIPSANAAARSSDQRTRHPIIILMTCCLSLFMIFMDVTIINVALPTIRASMHASTTELQWTIDAYTIVVASFLMLAGSMADRFGRRRVFQVGMACFSLGSILCGLAPTVSWLIGFRIVQAAGGAMLNPVALAIITNTFTVPRERARAVGVWSAVSGIAMAAGPVAGGFLIQALGWPSIFWINLPFGVTAIILAAIFIQESKAARPRRFDPVGQALVISLLFCVMAALIQGPQLGWRSLLEVLLLAGAAVACAGILLYEPKRRDPLIELRLFRAVPFASAITMAIACFASFGALLFFTSLVLQEIKGYTSAQAGLCIIPLALGTVICAPISGSFLGRWGARPSLVLAGLATIISAILLFNLKADSPVLYLLTINAIFGLGFGMVNAPITYTAISGLPADRAGVAAAFTSTGRQTGIALGVALIGMIGATGHSIQDHAALSLLENVQGLSWLLCITGLIMFSLGIISTSRWGMETARQASKQFIEGQPSSE